MRPLPVGTNQFDEFRSRPRFALPRRMSGALQIAGSRVDSLQEIVITWLVLGDQSRQLGGKLHRTRLPEGPADRLQQRQKGSRISAGIILPDRMPLDLREDPQQL